MKKLSFLFTLFMLLTAFTCEDEPLEGDFVEEEIDVVITDSDPSLIGDWMLVDMTADIISESNFGGVDIVSEFSVEINESDYVLTFAEATYTVAGDYELITTSNFNGQTMTSTDSYTNVQGSGTYSTSGNTMTIDGSFVEFEFDGMPVDIAEGEQAGQYSISADGQTLTFSQNDEEVTSEGGLNATTTTTSISVWEKLE